MDRIDLQTLSGDLPSLVERAVAGEDIVIAKGDKEVAKLTRVDPTPPIPRRPAGALGVSYIAPDFDAPEELG